MPHNAPVTHHTKRKRGARKPKTPAQVSTSIVDDTSSVRTLLTLRHQRERRQAGAAFAVEREGGDGAGQARSEARHPPGVPALRAPLVADAPEDLVDARRVDPGALHDRVHDMRGEDGCFGGVERDLTARYGHAVARQDCFRLILVNFHDAGSH